MSARSELLALGPAIAALLSSTIGLPASATPCADYTGHAYWYGGTSLGDLPTIVAPGDDLVLVADGADGMRVLDPVPPDRIRVLATVPGKGVTRAVDRLGDLAVATSDSVVEIVDISIPDSPVVVGAIEPAEAAQFALFDPRTDVLGGANGAPQVLYAAVLDHPGIVDPPSVEDWVKIWDVRDPAFPLELDRVHLDRAAADVTYVTQTIGGTKRSYLYVSKSDAGLEIIDVTNPADATFAAYTPLMQFCVATAVVGDVAYLAMGDGMEIVDVSDPESPTNAGFSFPPGNMYDVAAFGDELVVVTSTGVHVYELQDPMSPVLRRSYQVQSGPRKAAVRGERIYATDTRNLHILDVTARDPLPAAAILPLDGSARSITHEGSWAYVAGGAGGLHVLDVSKPLAPSLAGTLPPPSHEFVDVVVSGETAYVAGGMGGFHVVDVSVPSAPALVSTTPMGLNGATALAVAGTRVYVVEHGIGVRILDVSDPAAPATLGTYPAASQNATGIAIHGDALYLATTAGLHTIDVSDPAGPAQVDLDPRYYDGIEVAGAFAFATAGEYQTPSFAEVRVLDLGVPFAPFEIGRVEAGVSPVRFHVDGDLVYTACDRMGLHVVDASVPADPRNVGSILPDPFLGPNQTVRDVTVVDDLVYAACGAHGVRLYPRPCTTIDVASPVIEAGPGSLRVEARPSPFRAATAVRVALARDGEVRVSIHDVRGRLVRVLASDPLRAGTHTMTWDGCNAAGEPVSAGVYFVRARSGSDGSTAKVLRVR